MHVSDPILWVLAAFASFRIAYSLALDDGPADVFARFRTWLGCYDYGPTKYKNGEPRPRGVVGQWMSCPICVSLFPSAFVIVFLVAVGLWPVIALFGIAGASAIMFRWRNW